MTSRYSSSGQLSHLISKRDHLLFKYAVFLLTCSLALFFVAMSSGHVSADISDMIALLFHRHAGESQPLEHYVLWQLRLPRIVMAMVIGALLGMSGCALQGMVRNPLADPGIIGISSGAAVFAAAVIIFQPWLLISLGFLPEWLLNNLVIFAAFVGALLAVYLVMTIAKGSLGINVMTIILAGVAINALGGTLIGIMSYIASDDALRQITYWTMGSLGGITWSKAWMVMVLCVIPFWVFMRLRTPLNLLSLGESHARAMGINTHRQQQLLIWTVAFSVGLAISMCGIIGFVGLVVPHITRILFGACHKTLMPICGVFGALLMVLADMLSRTLVYPFEIPIGIVTSAIGAPFFLYLIYMQRQREEHRV
ncbi:MAG: FecCD family ABC transporter permease [Aestuariibacter sp.]